MMEIYEVEAIIPGKALIKAENECEAIKRGACLNFDDFNWDEFYISDLRRANEESKEW